MSDFLPIKQYIRIIFVYIYMSNLDEVLKTNTKFFKFSIKLPMFFLTSSEIQDDTKN